MKREKRTILNALSNLFSMRKRGKSSKGKVDKSMAPKAPVLEYSEAFIEKQRCESINRRLVKISTLGLSAHSSLRFVRSLECWARGMKISRKWWRD